MPKAGTMPGVSKKKPSPGRGPVERAVIYLEVDPRLKALMERLAADHDRRLTGECVQALKEYLARHQLWPPGEKGEG
jgi:hypothetical protein